MHRTPGIEDMERALSAWAARLAPSTVHDDPVWVEAFKQQPWARLAASVSELSVWLSLQSLAQDDPDCDYHWWASCARLRQSLQGAHPSRRPALRAELARLQDAAKDTMRKLGAYCGLARLLADAAAVLLDALPDLENMGERSHQIAHSSLHGLLPILQDQCQQSDCMRAKWTACIRRQKREIQILGQLFLAHAQSVQVVLNRKAWGVPFLSRAPLAAAKSALLRLHEDKWLELTSRRGTPLPRHMHKAAKTMAAKAWWSRYIGDTQDLVRYPHFASLAIDTGQQQIPALVLLLGHVARGRGSYWTTHSRRAIASATKAWVETWGSLRFPQGVGLSEDVLLAAAVQWRLMGEQELAMELAGYVPTQEGELVIP